MRPQEYLQQGMRYCGGYTIKAILSAYGLDDGRHPKKYLPLLIRIFGFTTPTIIKKVLEKYRLHCTLKRMDTLSDNEKINTLKKELQNNHPVVISIGNGYSPEGTYASWRRHSIAHWISLWGYDDTKKVFYVYDSYASPQHYDTVPIGNVQRSYEQILRDWRGTVYTRMRSFVSLIIKETDGTSQF